MMKLHRWEGIGKSLNKADKQEKRYRKELELLRYIVSMSAKIKELQSKGKLLAGFNIFILLVLLFIITGIFLTRWVVQNKSQENRTYAYTEEEEAQFCTNQPSCCDDIIKQLNEKGDISDLPDGEQPYHACDWPLRGYCQMSVCGQLPSGKKYRGECGWYWIWHDKDASPNKDIGTNMPSGYGCMIGDSEATMRPKYGSSPTNPPQPTNPPRPSDTPIPSEPTPTEILYPTETPIPTLPPGIYFSPTPQSSVPTQPIFYPTSVPTNPPPQITETVENTPTPIPTPFISKVTKQVSDFIQQTKEAIIKFFNTILP